jgi:hypothetical protein
VRDAPAAGDERVHPGDRLLYLVDVLNLTLEVAEISD